MDGKEGVHMENQLLFDINDLADLIGDSKVIKKAFPDGNWVIKWHFVDDEFQFKVIVKKYEKGKDKLTRKKK
jgi:hypothetical protein